MSLCETCKRAEYHGFPPEGSPEWEVGTVYFWCVREQTHGQREKCLGYAKGEPKMLDRHGRPLRVSDGVPVAKEERRSRGRH